MSPPVVIIGFGGHGRVVYAALRAAGREVLAAADLHPENVEKLPSGLDLLHDNQMIERYAANTVELALGIGSIWPSDSNSPRRNTVWNLKQKGYRFASIIHPAAWVAPDVTLGEGTQVHAGAIIQPGVEVGAFVIINTRASVDHDCTIGDFSHVGPGVTLSGSVDVGDGTHLGTASSVVQGIKIGRQCFVAAGSTVVCDLHHGEFVRGTPARPFQPKSLNSTPECRH